MITIVHGYDAEEIEEAAKEFNGKIVLYPEHKLHPRKQADLMIDLVIESRNQNLVIVTFSDVFVNYTGHLIWKNLVSRDEVAIIVVDGEGVRESKFDEETLLENWPYGFFNWGGHELEQFRDLKLQASSR